MSLRLLLLRAALVGSLWMVPGVAAQNALTPGAAWGAHAFPFDVLISDLESSRAGLVPPGTDSATAASIRRADSVLIASDTIRAKAWTIQLDLFSELAKDLDRESSGVNRPFRRYNDIESTLGFNQIGLTWIRRGPPGGSIWGATYLKQVWVSGGFEFDTFTRWLQNGLGHGVRAYAFVPRDPTDRKMHAPILAVGAEHSLIGDWRRSWPWGCCAFAATPLVGLGVSFSSVYVDEYATLGMNVRVRSTAAANPKEIIHLGGLIRAGRIQVPTKWYGIECGLADRYGMGQAWMVVPPFAEWLGQTDLPRVRVTYSRSIGPFIESRFKDGPSCEPLTRRVEPKIESLLSLRIEARSWAIETWNDVGFKDMGPTFGIRLVKYYDGL